MKFKIADKIFYRVPQFPINATLQDCWDELKRSIALASPDFYNEIKDTDHSSSSLLPYRQQQTILKYFNRSRFRPLPYGTFAAVGVIDPRIDDNETVITIDEAQCINSFIDWPCKDELSYHFEDVVRDDSLLFTNSTYYEIPDAIRYIYKNEEGFEIAELDSDSRIISVLKFCSNPIPLSELLIKAAHDFGDKEGCLNLIEELILAQLLLTSKDPNIIGEDFFKRIGDVAEKNNDEYVIAERKYIRGKIDKKILRHLPELADYMQQLNTSTGIAPNLKTFKEQFSKRFDRQEVPLMLALDPEMGLGYGQLESAPNGDVSIADFLPKQVATDESANDKLKAKLMNLLQNDSQETCIHLEELLDLNNLLDTNLKVANSISALLQVDGSNVVLSHLGGYSTNQFAGRFSLGIEEVYDFCKETARLEQHANPDVIFFDVGYTAEIKVDNVNRRRQIYDYQLSILNYDTSADPLTLDDMMVSVSNSEVILRSKKLNKRLMPRLATAYNYGRSDLSVFRFLCDLCVQGLATNLTLNIQETFPGLFYYPRIQFKNIIVSPASWIMQAKEYKHFTTGNDSKMDAFLFSKAIPRYIKIGASDQTLMLDMENIEDKKYLEAQLERNQQLKIEEAFLPNDSLMKDSNGKPFLGQFVVSLQHDEKIYNAASKKNIMDGCARRIYPPGSEWLYYEIFLHPSRADFLLQKLYEEFVIIHQPQIQQWFFIRYNEGGEHIRFRLLLNDPVYAGYAMKGFMDLLQDEIDSGIISDLQVKAYKRELERYGEYLIEDVEYYFCKDSAYVLNFLKGYPEDAQKYRSCLALFDEVTKSLLFSNDELLHWISKVHHSFTKEHGLTTDAFKKLNHYIGQLKPNEANQFYSEILIQQIELSQSLIRLLESCPNERRLELFTDLMHMHINRLFTQYQRTHEMLIYDVVLSNLKRKRALKLV